MRRTAAATITTVALALTACSGGTTEAEDSFAKGACGRFGTLAQDVTAGIVTDDEQRAALQDINDSARFSDDPAIADGATVMLAAATDGDDTALADAVRAFADACIEAGFGT